MREAAPQAARGGAPAGRQGGRGSRPPRSAAADVSGIAAMRAAAPQKTGTISFGSNATVSPSIPISGIAGKATS